MERDAELGIVPTTPLPASRWGTEHFQRPQAGAGSGFDSEGFEDLQDMLLYRRFTVAKDGGNLAVGLALRQPQQRFRDPWG